MKCRCPACGHKTQLEGDEGDFLVRCSHCSALLKPQAQACLKTNDQASFVEISRAAANPMRWRGGALTRLLTPPPPAPALGSMSGRPARGRVLRPEALREVTRAAARQKALKQAQLRGNHQALGALSVVVLSLVILLALGAIVLQLRGNWFHTVAGRTGENLSASPMAQRPSNN